MNLLRRLRAPIDYEGVAKSDAFILVNNEDTSKGKKFAIKAIEDPEARKMKLYAWAVRLVSIQYERKYKGFTMKGVKLREIDSPAEITNGSPVFVERGNFYKLLSVAEAMEASLGSRMFQAYK